MPISHDHSSMSISHRYLLFQELREASQPCAFLLAANRHLIAQIPCVICLVGDEGADDGARPAAPAASAVSAVSVAAGTKGELSVLVESGAETTEGAEVAKGGDTKEGSTTADDAGAVGAVVTMVATAKGEKAAGEEEEGGWDLPETPSPKEPEVTSAFKGHHLSPYSAESAVGGAPPSPTADFRPPPEARRAPPSLPPAAGTVDGTVDGTTSTATTAEDATEVAVEVVASVDAASVAVILDGTGTSGEGGGDEGDIANVDGGVEDALATETKKETTEVGGGEAQDLVGGETKENGDGGAEVAGEKEDEKEVEAVVGANGAGGTSSDAGRSGRPTQVAEVLAGLSNQGAVLKRRKGGGHVMSYGRLLILTDRVVLIATASREVRGWAAQKSKHKQQQQQRLTAIAQAGSNDSENGGGSAVGSPASTGGGSGGSDTASDAGTPTKPSTKGGLTIRPKSIRFQTQKSRRPTAAQVEAIEEMGELGQSLDLLPHPMKVSNETRRETRSPLATMVASLPRHSAIPSSWSPFIFSPTVAVAVVCVCVCVCVMILYTRKHL